MPESNGRENWTASLRRVNSTDPWGQEFCFARSEYPDRVRYEADRVRWIIGELPERPDILAYDADKHSGYVPPASPVVPVGRKEIIDMLNKMTFQMAGAPAVADAILAALRPVVPVGSADTLPPISLDGPHKIGEHRQWLARQLLDSRQDDAEAYSTVIYSPAMTDIWRDGVVPVGVSREDEAWSLAMGIPAFNDLPAQFQQDIHAAIIAALRPNDTGQSALQPSASVPTKREVRLVLAARAVAFGDHFSPAAIKELDAASEAYAADVPWADTPERFEPCGGCGEADPAKRCIGCLHNFATPAAPTDTGANHD
jgi:hypothetical protein